MAIDLAIDIRTLATINITVQLVLITLVFERYISHGEDALCDAV